MSKKSENPSYIAQGDLMFPILEVLAKNRGTQKIAFVLGEVLKLVGRDASCNGEVNGKPKIYNQISNAKMELGFRDCVISSQGGWEITQAGVDALGTRTLPPKREGWLAVKNPHKKNRPPVVATATVEASPKEKKSSPKKASAKAGKTVSSGEASEGPPSDPSEDSEGSLEAKSSEPQTPPPVSSDIAIPRVAKSKLEVVVESDWKNDPAIRAMVAKQTSCFGSFHPLVSACGNCALRVDCGKSLASILHDMAEAMEREAKQSGTSPVLGDVAEEVAKNLSKEPKGPARKPVRSAVPVTVSYDGCLCARTRSALSKGTSAYYFPGVGIVGSSTLTKEEKEALSAT